MKDETLLDEIREANLSYLLLAQRLLRTDRAEALYRLGIGEEIAGIIDQLTTSQLVRVAGSSQLMCRFRCEDRLVWDLLATHSRDRGVSAAHAAIVMNSALAEAA
ncbi:MAG: flagellar transcriptional regulator FlhD [Burkholderiales bacterium]